MITTLWYSLCKNERPDMFHLYIGSSVLLYYFVSFAGTYALIIFSKLLPKSNFAVTISLGTFLILAIHLIILPYLKFSIIEMDKTRFIALSIIILICIPCISLANKTCPIFLGKSRIKYSKLYE